MLLLLLLNRTSQPHQCGPASSSAFQNCGVPMCLHANSIHLSPLLQVAAQVTVTPCPEQTLAAACRALRVCMRGAATIPRLLQPQWVRRCQSSHKTTVQVRDQRTVGAANKLAADEDLRHGAHARDVVQRRLRRGSQIHARPGCNNLIFAGQARIQMHGCMSSRGDRSLL